MSPTADGLIAVKTEESTRDNREQPARIGKYHPDCYAAAKEGDGRLPDVG